MTPLDGADGWSVHSGVLIRVQQKSDQLFYVFAGIKRGLMGNPMAFLQQTGLLVRNVALFVDPAEGYYQGGVNARLDSYDRLLGWQQTFRVGLPHVRRVFCLGTSMGGYAAVLFGHALCANEVWAFSPLTMAAPEVGRRIPAERADLARLLRSSNGVTRYNVYYNEADRTDRDAAERLGTCPGVRLWPQRGDGHNVVKTMLEDGRLATLLPPAC
jgi:hypothetical protein